MQIDHNAITSLAIATFFYLLSCQAVLAQAGVSIKGKITDSQTGQPLPYANIRLQDRPIGTISGPNGQFSLVLPDNTAAALLVCSAIGYATYLAKTDTLPPGPLTIGLVPVNYMLDTVVIYARQGKLPPPEKMVNKAIGKLAKTCPPFRGRGALRHYIIENGRYVKYSEADITVTDTKGYGRKLNPLKLNEQIRWSQKRESLTMQQDLTADYGYFILETNPFRFLLHNALKYKFNLKDHLFDLKDTVWENNRKVYLIYAKGHEDKKKFADWYDMKFYLLQNPADARDLNLIRFEISYQEDTTISTLTHVITSTFAVDLSQQGRYYRPEKFSYLMMQRKRWQGRPEISVDHTISYEMVLDEVDFRLPGLNRIAAVNNVYDGAHWRHKPLGKKLVADLSCYMPLEKQFALQADKKHRARVQDSLDLLKLQKLITQVKGKKHVYLLVWQAWEPLLAYQDPKNWPAGKDLYPVLVSGRKDRADWAFIVTGMNAIYFRNIHLPYSWQSILPPGAGKTLPAYVLIHKDGRVEYSATPFSQDYLEKLE